MFKNEKFLILPVKFDLRRSFIFWALCCFKIKRSFICVPDFNVSFE